MNAKHTPGPWIITDGKREPRTIKIGTGPKGWLGVAQAFGDTNDEADANARLIAFAPDLLAACEDAKETFQRLCEESDNEDLVNQALWVLDTYHHLALAIAKAKG